ncbi:MAG: DUF2807 domain-containing protein [Cytophagales bacterium]|nr:DUF2807 domain-containing protein [Cytophagales bacterium]
MKSIVLSGLLLASLFFSSCRDCLEGQGSTTRQTLQLAYFDKIRVSGPLDVYVSQGDEQKVEVEGHQNVINDLKRSTGGNEWDIEFRSPCVEDIGPFKVFITVPKLERVKIDGSGDVLFTGSFGGQDLDLAISGSGDVSSSGALTFSQIHSSISGSGTISLQGSASTHRIDISGSGDVLAYELATSTTRVEISGSGKAEVSASELLAVKISGSGDVFYKGDPSIEVEVSGSGGVKKVD